MTKEEKRARDLLKEYYILYLEAYLFLRTKNDEDNRGYAEYCNAKVRGIENVIEVVFPQINIELCEARWRAQFYKEHKED